MKKKRLILVLAALLLAAPVFAVFNEKDLSKTISILRYELKVEHDRQSKLQENYAKRDKSQHSQMIDMMKKCNELALMLYSQDQDYTFDVTYALKSVSDEYESYSQHRLPFDQIVSKLTLEIDRYEHLVASLKRIPPRIIVDNMLPDSLILKDTLAMALRARRNSIRAESGAEDPKVKAIREELVNIDREKFQQYKNSTFQLDSAGLVDRDSCLYYASDLLLMYTQMRDEIVKDNEHYADASKRLEESYSYAQDRYKLIQKSIFVDGQSNYFKVLKYLRMNLRTSMQQCKDKYGFNYANDVESEILGASEWKATYVLGFVLMVLLITFVAVIVTLILYLILRSFIPAFRTEDFRKRLPCYLMLNGMAIFMILTILSIFNEKNFVGMAGGILFVYAWLVFALLLSLVVRANADKVRPGMKLYAPIVVLGLIVISFRIIFIPNILLNIVFPPMLVGFFIWQLMVCRKLRKEVNTLDIILGWISLAIMGVTAVMSIVGYVLLSVQVFIWWLFQLSAIATIMAVYELLLIYKEKRVIPKIRIYQKELGASLPQMKTGAHIRVTWLFDLLKMVLIPLLVILSIPLSLFSAADVFDLTEFCKQFISTPFVHLESQAGDIRLDISMSKILVATGLFFIFRYINYLLRSIYALIRLQAAKKEAGRDELLTNEVNLTLANNVIGILVWGTYIITLVILLKIPMGAISIVAAGLATGLGLAMKDILNNFIYGIQLMSGRLRVGDYIECDGVRGKVTGISYQSTQIETETGAVMSFLNTDLFSRNFTNLTRNNSYELLRITVGVAYGTDIDRVRQIIIDATEQFGKKKDKFGRYTIDQKKGVSVSFSKFGDNSVDIVVKQSVLVQQRYAYEAEVKEAIYNALNANGIQIPFPQRDIHIIK